MNVISINAKLKELSPDPIHDILVEEELDTLEYLDSFYALMELNNLDRLKIPSFLGNGSFIYMIRKGDLYTIADADCVDVFESALQVAHERNIRNNIESKVRREIDEVVVEKLSSILAQVKPSIPRLL